MEWTIPQQESATWQKVHRHTLVLVFGGIYISTFTRLIPVFFLKYFLRRTLLLDEHESPLIVPALTSSASLNTGIIVSWGTLTLVLCLVPSSTILWWCSIILWWKCNWLKEVTFILRQWCNCKLDAEDSSGETQSLFPSFLLRSYLIMLCLKSIRNLDLPKILVDATTKDPNLVLLPFVQRTQWSQVFQLTHHIICSFIKERLIYWRCVQSCMWRIHLCHTPIVMSSVMWWRFDQLVDSCYDAIAVMGDEDEHTHSATWYELLQYRKRRERGGGRRGDFQYGNSEMECILPLYTEYWVVQLFHDPACCHLC